MKLNFKDPVSAELVSDFDVERNSGVLAARAIVTKESAALDAAERRLAEASNDVARHTRSGAMAALEDALVAEKAAALAMPAARARVDAAAASVVSAMGVAKMAIITEANKRRDYLQSAIADELAPALAKLRECEAALDEAVRRAGGTEVQPLTWPCTLADEAESRNTFIAMRMAKPVLGVIAAIVLMAASAFAQAPQVVQQSASHADAATRCDSAAGTGTVTLALQDPGPGLSDYITFVILNGELTAAVTPAAPVAFTTTGIAGTSPTLGDVQLLAGATGAVVGPGLIPFPTALKANMNTAPTITLVGITNQSTRMTACYYVAP